MRVRISFDVEINAGSATDRQIQDYLRFSFNDNGVLDGSNPFVDLDAPEPIFGTFTWRRA